ncbi:hypothetical protein A4F89_06770 [Polynucleobacter asymbioticus]|jgi:uncharacterized protein (DUF4415 family)|uniref:hypothetical protein n=1 Tax=Polynucleobacter asymbioticus TaxID=576611 RepID=UPI0008FB9B38|nr:hypothetical protein [Polynucleobacter asymbioticus]APB99051.1 hypothetical protein A4F89_06770 [Polynucleobacter asymbioticus]
MNAKQVATEIADTPEAWENGEIGQSFDHAVVAPSKLASEIDEALGLQMISIRLNKDLIDAFKLLGIKHEMGYQPLMREALKRFVEGEYKMIAQEHLERQKAEKKRAATQKLAKAA